MILMSWIPAYAGMTNASDYPVSMIVLDPIVDVRAEPVKRKIKFEYDPLQETQVLQGERVETFERKGKWSRVECPAQLEFTHNNRWQGYPGWVLTKSLTSDLKYEKKPNPPTVFDDSLRQGILKSARWHLGEAYLWGGRSRFDSTNKKILTGVDCSGLINWSYHQMQWLIPRDAHEQWMTARRINPSELKPADLIFLAKADKPEKIVHVVLYSEGGMIIEAPQSGERVREIPFEKKFGKKLQETKNADLVNDRIIYFGTLFPEKQ